MEKKFNGLKLNGFLILFVVFAMISLSIYLFFQGSTTTVYSGIVILILALIISIGFTMIDPNDMRVMVFFGKYEGTLSQNGFYWVNPFTRKIKLTYRARNLDISPIKVNDKGGNPIMIGFVLVWRVKDSFKAIFDIDSSDSEALNGTVKPNIMLLLQKFVAIQSDSALRNIASKYSYDCDDSKEEVTLRSGSNVIVERLEEELNSRLAIAGIEVLEARISHLAYAPEIAAIMLRRQQATAIISAREKIVNGAVSMVKMALTQLSDDNIVELNEDKKAVLVSNLLVVLCSDSQTQPVVNAGMSQQ